MKLSRRSFIKLGGAVLAALGLGVPDSVKSAPVTTTGHGATLSVFNDGEWEQLGEINQWPRMSPSSALDSFGISGDTIQEKIEASRVMGVVEGDLIAIPDEYIYSRDAGGGYTWFIRDDDCIQEIDNA